MVLRVIRLARIVRIAKLSRHSRNLNTLIKTMSTSLRELSFLMLFFIVSMVLYATFVYYCEQGYSPGADDAANEVGFRMVKLVVYTLFSLSPFRHHSGGQLWRWPPLAMVTCTRAPQWAKLLVSCAHWPVCCALPCPYRQSSPIFTDFIRLVI